jgi:hypothetical protein
MGYLGHLGSIARRFDRNACCKHKKAPPVSKKLEALKMTKAPKALTCSAVAMSGGHASHFGGMSALTILSALVISVRWSATTPKLDIDRLHFSFPWN